MSDLVVVFMIGLVGSAHCVGMCGGFALALAHDERERRRLHARQTLYHLGKTTTYALLGGLAGGGGAALASTISGAQNALSIVLGLFLIGVGLGVLGVLRRFEGFRRVGRWRAFTARMAAFLRKRTLKSAYGLGLVNGLLPCGLVYAVLAKAAATGSVSGGALTMAVFGAATVPALYGLALTGFLMRPVRRARLNLVGGILVIVLGVVTLARGTPLLHAVMGHGNEEHQGREMVEPGAHDAAPPAPSPEHPRP
jgi:sulfite exporter TauE/SafE